MKKHTKNAILGLALLGSAIQGQAQIEYIQNGGFETGDFTGWSVANTGSGAWAINDGTLIPPGPGGALAPISGNFDAVSIQGGGGTRIVSQCFVVPPNVQAAVLGWTDRIRNHAGVFSDPNQEWRVWILDENQTPLFEVFSTNPGDPLIQVGPNGRAFDLTAALQALEGQSICVSFTEQDNLYYFNTTLDDVSFVVAANVTIGGCDTGVVDLVVTDDGRSITDLIEECAASATNHGGFVSCVAAVTNALKKAGVISGADKGRIQSCAAQANIP